MFQLVKLINISAAGRRKKQPQCCKSTATRTTVLMAVALLLFLASTTSSLTTMAMSRGGEFCPSVCQCKWKGGKQTVECIDKQLITIPENMDQTTQVLDMSGNNLQQLPRETFIRLDLLNLQKLFLRNCKLGQIDVHAFKGLTNLVELDLSQNLLTAIPSTTFMHIPSLRDLTLSRNPIQKIEPAAFQTVPSLVKLDLSHCDLMTIAPQAFESLELLHSLKLNGNKLSELRPRTVETLSKLHGVELHDNPWMCDCRLRAAKIWLAENNIPYPVAPACSGGPERVIDRTFDDLQVDDFACRPEILPVNRFIEAFSGDNATILCRTGAVPSAQINWYWNGRMLANNSAFSAFQKVHIYETGEFEKTSRLVVTNAQDSDSSEFYCVAENRAGSAEANFTLHVTMRAGITALGQGQIAGLSLALVVLILFILLVIMFLLVRLRRTPFSESKTPGQLDTVITANSTTAGITTTVSPIQSKNNLLTTTNTPTNNHLGNKSINNNLHSPPGSNNNNNNNNHSINNNAVVDWKTLVGDSPKSNANSAAIAAQCTTASHASSAAAAGNGEAVPINASQQQQLMNNLRGLHSPPSLTLGGSGTLLSPAKSNNHFPGSAMTMNPVQKPPRLGDQYDQGSLLAMNLNNPDLINDTHNTKGGATTSDNFAKLLQESSSNNKTDSGEYVRAGGCDSLYPSGLWENAHLTSGGGSGMDFNQELYSLNHHQNYQQQHQHLLNNNHYQQTSSLSSVHSYSDKTPILGHGTSLSNCSGVSTTGGVNTMLMNRSEGVSAEFISRTLPRSQLHNSSNKMQQPYAHQFASSSSATGAAHSASSIVDATVPTTSSSSNGGGYPADYGLPIVAGAEHEVQKSYREPLQQPPGMPTNAKTLRVWQRGGVPVLPPVTALKRALTSSRNSPDEGYQEGCGTDV